MVRTGPGLRCAPCHRCHGPCSVSPPRSHSCSRGDPTGKVIIHLGNNGILIHAADCDRITEVAGSSRTVYLVILRIPRSCRRIPNEPLDACARRRANMVLIDWFHHSRDHPSWFAADGFHLTSTGQKRFASLIVTETA